MTCRAAGHPSGWRTLGSLFDEPGCARSGCKSRFEIELVRLHWRVRPNLDLDRRPSRPLATALPLVPWSAVDRDDREISLEPLLACAARRMKVLFVNSLYWPHEIGGAERAVRSLAEGYAQFGGHERCRMLVAGGNGRAAGRRVSACPSRAVGQYSILAWPPQAFEGTSRGLASRGCLQPCHGSPLGRNSGQGKARRHRDEQSSGVLGGCLEGCCGPRHSLQPVPSRLLSRAAQIHRCTSGAPIASVNAQAAMSCEHRHAACLRCPEWSARSVAEPWHVWWQPVPSIRSSRAL